MKCYAGIGSRQTPPSILSLMTLIACALRVQGYTLLSGHADGADQAFEKGAEEQLVSFLPWPKFNAEVAHHPGATVVASASFAAAEVAAAHHPAWARLSQGARKLHARNAHQVLGRDCASPVGFVLCWTPDGKASGGTGGAIRIAEANGISVFNLHDRAVQLRMARMVRKTILAQRSLSEALRARAGVMLDELEHELGLVSDTGNVLSEPDAHGCAGCADAACGFCRAATLARHEVILDAADARVADGAAPKRRFEYWSGYTDPRVGVTLYG